MTKIYEGWEIVDIFSLLTTGNLYNSCAEFQLNSETNLVYYSVGVNWLCQ